MQDDTPNPTASSDRTPLCEGEELAELLEVFARVEKIREPMPRKFALLKEAERRQASLGDYQVLFQAYIQDKKHSKWRLERLMQSTERWLRSLTFLRVLQYLGSLAIIIVVVTFFVGLPARLRQRNHELWQMVQAGQGRVFDSERIGMLEELNQACFKLEGLEAEGAYLSGVRLDGCRGLVAWLLAGRWSQSPLLSQGAELHSANLKGAALVGARLPGANLTEARLSEARLERADLRGASLRAADLSGADLFRADLRDADRSGAILEGAGLSRANLSGANLTGARLSKAQLVRASLRQATLEYADCAGANFAGADLRGGRIFRADLSHASMRKAKLDRRTTLDEADLAGTDLTGASVPSVLIFQNAANWRSARLPSRSAGPKPRPPSVTLVVTDEQHYFRDIELGARRAADEGGARLKVRSLGRFQDHLQGERSVVRSEIVAGVDVLVLVPQHRVESTPLMEEAFRAGVELVCYDQCGLDPVTARYFSAGFESDQTELGRSTGRYLGRWLRNQRSGHARVAVHRACEFEGCFRRVEGFRAGLDESRARVTEVAYHMVGPSESPDEVARRMLIDHPETTILWSANEAGTEAAVEAVHAAGRVGEVAVFGTDISPELARMLLDDDNVLQSVTAQLPEEMGYRATRAAIAAVRGTAAPFERQLVGHRLLTRHRSEDVQWLTRHMASGTAPGFATDR